MVAKRGKSKAVATPLSIEEITRAEEQKCRSNPEYVSEKERRAAEIRATRERWKREQTAARARKTAEGLGIPQGYLKRIMTSKHVERLRYFQYALPPTAPVELAGYVLNVKSYSDWDREFQLRYWNPKPGTRHKRFALTEEEVSAMYAGNGIDYSMLVERRENEIAENRKRKKQAKLDQNDAEAGE